jgi:hypothetical protein
MSKVEALKRLKADLASDFESEMHMLHDRSEMLKNSSEKAKFYTALIFHFPYGTISPSMNLHYR